MPLHVDAVYENGVLKPLRPIDLAENEQVALTITPINRVTGIYEPDLEYVETLRNSLKSAGHAPGLEEVRRRLSKIPGSMTTDFIAEREDR